MTPDARKSLASWLLLIAAAWSAAAGPGLAAGKAAGPLGYHAEGRFGRGDGKWRPLVVERRGADFRFEFDDKDTPGLRWAIIGDSHTDKAQILAVRWTGARPPIRPVNFRQALSEAGIDPFDFFVDGPVAQTHSVRGFKCGPPHPDLAGCATTQGAPVYEDSQTTGLRLFELDRVKNGPVAPARFETK
jgi:hypothetical protein